MSKFVKNVYEKKVIGNLQIAKMTIRKRKDEFITKEELIELQNDLEEKTSYNNVIIRGKNGIGWSTIKARDDDYNTEEFYDYYSGKVVNNAKFSEFYQLDLIIYKNLKKK